ncbi:exosome complex component [Raphidocelis subcapitata]|uniref:Exosome complex component n=1 Tax=Raphidocelis subcapitata TaxID=307507 RepID=A0A2V0NN47_9CHLO|nr:exosome complex component [Raphidocelis subcapitata]|eukprot:GBF88956.1 exosome complex component [Raphidocelis subcapitata]
MAAAPATAGSSKPASVPLQPLPRPATLVADGTRLDGRGLEEFRTVFLDTRVISRAAGSAYAEFNSTKVMAAVYGPRQGERRFGFSDTGRLNVEACFTSFARREGGRQAQRAAEKELASCLAAALEPSVDLGKLPKSVLDVYVMVLEAGGSEAAVAATAASLALADAGVELFDLVAACSVSDVSGQLLLDPSAAEAAQQRGGLLLAAMPSLGEVTQLQMSGDWAPGAARDALELALGGCAQLRAGMRDTLLAAEAARQQQRRRDGGDGGGGGGGGGAAAMQE